VNQIRHGTHSEARTERMLQMCAAGLTLQQVGDQFGITRERVRQIVASRGMKKDSRGVHVRTNSSRQKVAETKAMRRDHRAMQNYGCAYGVVLALNGPGLARKESLASRFRMQRKNAQVRGIEFHISFSDWVAVWQKSGHLHQRGRGHGKYVMSRFGDVGAYKLGNVFIQLADENCSEGNKRAWARKRAAGMQAAA
jgi:hypothetical protein